MQIWDVAIVGCGPVGAFMANLLGQAGLKTLVLDRDTAPYALPRAVHIDHEMVRLLASIGLGDEMLAQMRAGDGHVHVGADYGLIRYLSVAGKPSPYGYANDYFFYQPELETTLRRGLTRFANVEMRVGAVVTEIDAAEEHVGITLADGETVYARWVIGCDGARSTIRKLLEVRLDDLDFDEPWLVVDAEVEGKISFPDFGGVPEGANLQNLSLMMCDPKRPATIVPGRGNHRRWEFMLLPGENDTEMASPERVAALVEPWVQGARHTIIRAATYQFHGLVAEQWRKGRVFLAGDSAHQTPPFFGQGMCHGLRDAANLSWKLALVIEGKADEALLDTYQIEREAQVRHVIGAAIDAGKYICELDPERAVQRDARVRGESKIRSASELIAPIASRIIGAGAGERFINPRLTSGELFDAKTWKGWILLELEHHALSESAVSVIAALRAQRLVLGADFADSEDFLKRWFTERNITAALIRPDFYVGSVGCAKEINERLTALGTALGLVQRDAELEH